MAREPGVRIGLERLSVFSRESSSRGLVTCVRRCFLPRITSFSMRIVVDSCQCPASWLPVSARALVHLWVLVSESLLRLAVSMCSVLRAVVRFVCWRNFINTFWFLLGQGCQAPLSVRSSFCTATLFRKWWENCRSSGARFGLQTCRPFSCFGSVCWRVGACEPHRGESRDDFARSSSQRHRSRPRLQSPGAHVDHSSNATEAPSSSHEL